MFASADLANMDKVKDLVGTPQNFASNQLQIVVEKGNPKNVATVEDLANSDLKVVLAAPEVPAGKYAAEILGKAGVTVKPVSEEDNVKAVVTKVSLGEADAGIVYVTDVTAGGDKVEGVEIPEELNVVATYPIATVKESKAQTRRRRSWTWSSRPRASRCSRSTGSSRRRRRDRDRSAPAAPGGLRHRARPEPGPGWFAVPAALAVGFLASPCSASSGGPRGGASAPS